MTTVPVVGVDLSLQASGIATPLGVRTVKSEGREDATLLERRGRLHSLAAMLSLIVADAAPFGGALVMLEAPSYNSKYGHAHDRSGLWWLVVDELVDCQQHVAEVSPKQRAKYATGNGNAGKPAVASAASHRYGHLFQNDNEADAFVLRAMGLDLLGSPLAEVPQKNREALARLALPEGVLP